MSAISPIKRTLGLLGAIVAAAALATAFSPVLGGACAADGFWQDPDRIATSVAIDDEGIVICTESKDGGDPETIEISATGEDNLVIIGSDEAKKKWRKKWKDEWKKDCERGERIHIDWDWGDFDDLEWFDFDDYEDCDGDAIIHFGSDIHIGKRERIDGDVVAIGGSVYIDGRVEGDVVAVGGSVTLGPRAEVDGDVVALAGDLDLRDGCEIDGDAVSVGGDIDDDGADIHGDTVLVEFDLW